MPKFNLEFFKTLVLNFAYIHYKRRKLGMFILFQKYQCVYPNKVNSPLIRHIPSFPWLNVKAQENLKIYFWGKIHFVLGLLARDIRDFLRSRFGHFTAKAWFSYVGKIPDDRGFYF